MHEIAEKSLRREHGIRAYWCGEHYQCPADPGREKVQTFCLTEQQSDPHDYKQFSSLEFSVDRYSVRTIVIDRQELQKD